MKEQNENLIFKVSDAIEADVEEIFEMKLKSWITTYAHGKVTEQDIRNIMEPRREGHLKSFRNIINNHKSGEEIYPVGIKVAKVDNKIVGIVTPMIFNNQNRVGSIYILEEYQGKGLGKMLINEVLKAFPEEDIYLHVQTENTNAIKFYENIGFTKTKDLPTEYFDKEKTKELNQIEMTKKNLKF